MTHKTCGVDLTHSGTMGLKIVYIFQTGCDAVMCSCPVQPLFSTATLCKLRSGLIILKGNINKIRLCCESYFGSQCLNLAEVGQRHP